MNAIVAIGRWCDLCCGAQVHPIEGVVRALAGVARALRAPALGLQCAAAAPLTDMSALAAFYVRRVRAAQPRPPYTLLGYSFGASVAFEMALQLEQVRLHIVKIETTKHFFFIRIYV